MYERHFGLREMPFGLTPDTSFFFSCSSYREALNTLVIATANGEGFIKVTGEVGNGKTMLCRRYLAALADVTREAEQADPAAQRPRYATAYVPNPYLDPKGLLQTLADEFGVPVGGGELHHAVKALTAALMEFARQEIRPVVCLDEAQAMPLATLEALRLLTNLETEKRKLLQVVLFGQPELDERLRQPSVRQLLQRITFHYELQGLEAGEIDQYLSHRLRVAGHGAGRVFLPAAVRLIHEASGGTPRLVNVLAHKALLAAFGEGAHEVAVRHARAAAADTPSARRARARWFQSLLGGPAR